MHCITIMKEMNSSVKELEWALECAKKIRARANNTGILTRAAGDRPRHMRTDSNNELIAQDAIHVSIGLQVMLNVLQKELDRINKISRSVDKRGS